MFPLPTTTPEVKQVVAAMTAVGLTVERAGMESG